MHAKNIIVLGYVILSITIPVIVSFDGKSVRVGYWVTAIILPVATINIVTPSSLHKNYSPRIIGDIIAENIIVKHDVELINKMFPNLMATIFVKKFIFFIKYYLHAFKVWLNAMNISPTNHSTCKQAFLCLYFSTRILAIFIKIRPNAVQKLPEVEKIRAIILVVNVNYIFYFSV